jgi:hypothetical protein
MPSTVTDPESPSKDLASNRWFGAKRYSQRRTRAR